MEAFLVSTGIVVVAEIGDKTQLLALMLSARFRKPWVIITGILAATLLNHALAGLVGEWIRTLLAPNTLRFVVSLSFIAMAFWTLKPDRLDTGTSPLGPYGVLAVTFLAFFVAEMGDKTQLATVALAARYTNLTTVVAGTTLGMLLANAPAVLLGDAFASRMPLKQIRYIAAGMFAAMGVAALIGFHLQ